MRKLISLLLLLALAFGVIVAFSSGSIGAQTAKTEGRIGEENVNFGRRYNNQGMEETGASNIVSSVVITYRGFDTLGEVTVLFIAALGLSLLLHNRGKQQPQTAKEPASLIVFSGCRFLFPLILLFGAYIFVHGHLTPGGGFQGGAIIASGFLLIYLGCRGKTVRTGALRTVESLSGLFFVLVGLMGLIAASSFLFNFLPKGSPYALFSAGVIPVIYVFIGLKVGSELAGVIANLAGEEK
ncbi:MAG: Na(+)/H(+) antiporter subunit B [Planctomycetes bacterium]|nr:Na(+)/H(+) antiporter subunit B [Planctomycetota bacterium]